MGNLQAWVRVVFFISVAVPTALYGALEQEVNQQFERYSQKLDETYRNILAKKPHLQNRLGDRPKQQASFGYGLLPEITTSGRVSLEVLEREKKHSERTYSWKKTREVLVLDEQRLAVLENLVQSQPQANVDDQIISAYTTLRENQNYIIDLINYNRVWQKDITLHKDFYDSRNKLLAILRQRDTVLGNSKKYEKLNNEFVKLVYANTKSPKFLKVVRKKNKVILSIKIYTDINDQKFRQTFKDVIEEYWQVTDRNKKYSILLNLVYVPVEKLYLKEAPPGVSQRINIDNHVARFPKDGGVLTTGAQSTYGQMGSFVVFGPAKLDASVLAHEFGHLLGLPDVYLRAYKKISAEDNEIVEASPGRRDLMASPGEGYVFSYHFEKIINSVKKKSR
ncbi:MAG: hypothetical protein AB7F43_03045 [Bacteriovoracia bacterium]